MKTLNTQLNWNDIQGRCSDTVDLPVDTALPRQPPQQLAFKIEGDLIHIDVLEMMPVRDARNFHRKVASGKLIHHEGHISYQHRGMGWLSVLPAVLFATLSVSTGAGFLPGAWRALQCCLTWDAALWTALLVSLCLGSVVTLHGLWTSYVHCKKRTEEALQLLLKGRFEVQKRQRRKPEPTAKPQAKATQDRPVTWREVEGRITNSLELPVVLPGGDELGGSHVVRFTVEKNLIRLAMHHVVPSRKGGPLYDYEVAFARLKPQHDRVAYKHTGVNKLLFIMPGVIFGMSALLVPKLLATALCCFGDSLMLLLMTLVFMALGVVFAYPVWVLRKHAEGTMKQALEEALQGHLVWE